MFETIVFVAAVTILPTASEGEAQQPPEGGPPAPTLTRAPELLTFVEADYPEGLLADGIGGEVILVIDIDASGTVSRAEVQRSSNPAFEAPALVAASSFIFSPAEVDGEPAAIRIEYRYVFEPRTVEVSPAPEQRAPEAPAPINLAGTILESPTRHPISGAVILIDGEPVAESDDAGHFAARGVPTKTVEVRVTTPYHTAFETQEDVTEGERLEVTYYLRRERQNPYETIVTTQAEHKEVARVELTREETKQIPGTFGDPIRVIENLPGMARTPGGLGGALLVRGANPNDTGVYVDGVQVPFLFHLGGLTSIVNPEFLETVDFMPGGFGARYSRATAGIVEVESRTLDCELVRGVGDIDAIDAGAFACAPAGDWYVAGGARRSYVDAFLPGVMKRADRDPDESLTTVAPVYFDYQLKTGTHWGRQRFSAFAFGATDFLEVLTTASAEDARQSFGGDLQFHRVSLQHTIDFGDGVTLSSTLTPGLTRQHFGFESDTVSNELEMNLDVWGIDWREDLSVEVNEQLTVNAGIDHALNYWVTDMRVDLPPDVRTYPSSIYDLERTQRYDVEVWDLNQGYWAEAVVEPLEGLRIVPGLRVDGFDFDQTNSWTASPRLAARYELVPGSTAKAAWGVYRQLPNPELIVEGIGQPHLDPERSQHFIVGFEQDLAGGIDIDVELFYNRRDRLPSPTDAIEVSDGEARPVLWNSKGTGRSYGAELLLRRAPVRDGRFYGWVAYTLSRSLRRDATNLLGTDQYEGNGAGTPRFADLNERPVEYLSPYDQTHLLTVVGQWILPWDFEAGFRFQLASGNPYTAMDGARTYFDGDTGAYEIVPGSVERNGDRSPTYHRLDVRVDKHFVFDTWTLTAYLEVLNVYNQKNVESFTYDYRYDRKSELPSLPLIPVLGMKGEF